ncbi:MULTISPECIES: hypothetical protein [unclassified Bradyrhizobium]|uniref:hypothetical protein n=2 Tax=unclassified Bradyrhizobium TaxID=2631580 RepID=UPI0028EB81D1|nr:MULTISPECIES: hypothetical protein [unclassified Bradyrhizobium]
MWMTIISFLGGPVIKGLIQAYQAKLQAGTTDAKIAADLAAAEIAAQQLEIQQTTALKIAEIGHPWEIEKLFAYVTLVYYAKLLIWDKVLGLGTTDPLAGWALVAANLVISFYFTKRGFENVARIIKR